ncbi:hypothetical protein BDZ97DRAFT_1924241 [Flammula alnicola]|nr:hypothetical protein BDZ97DRAFT_1924241 [Flammula alnicola]
MSQISRARAYVLYLLLAPCVFRPYLNASSIGERRSHLLGHLAHPRPGPAGSPSSVEHTPAGEFSDSLISAPGSVNGEPSRDDNTREYHLQAQFPAEPSWQSSLVHPENDVPPHSVA